MVMGPTSVLKSGKYGCPSLSFRLYAYVVDSLRGGGSPCQHVGSCHEPCGPPWGPTAQSRASPGIDLGYQKTPALPEALVMH